MPQEPISRRILLAEDEAIIALAIEDMLAGLGYHVVGPAYSLASARELAENEAIDGAVLDVNLGDGTSDEVARLLRSRAIPFCFSTGYGLAGLSAEFADVPVLQKPYRMEALGKVLEGMIA